MQVDLVTISTIWHFMQRVCKEMRWTMERTATNVLTTTLHDLAYGIWDANGRAVAIPEGFPPRLISSSFVIKTIIKNFDKQIYPGDVLLTNHPFKAGAVHLPDWVFVRPVFYKDELIFFTCMGTHVPDTGGARAGTYFLAFDSIAEGLNIPPVKLVERGQMREDVLELILSNNRLPDLMRREIRSLIGSTGVAEKRLLELLEKKGKDVVLATIEEMLQRTEKAVRSEISKWPKGTYYAEAQLDDDGVDFRVPVTVRCKLTIKEDEVVFDFSESDDQRKGYTNATYPLTFSDTACATFLFLDPNLREYHNEGSLKPIKVITRKGTVVDCNPGALTAAAPSAIGRLVIECVLSSLSQALPYRAIASWSKPLHLMLIGTDPRTKEMYVYVSFCPAGGAGAVSGYDGYQCCCDLGALGVATKTDAEDEMIRFPWRVITYEFSTDSCGAGKWRGAPGIVWKGVNEGGECSSIMGPCDGWSTQSTGLFGGHPTPFNKAYIIRGNERIDIINPHKIQNLEKGDILCCESCGGAGIGPPDERDTEAVEIDVKNEIISRRVAYEIYKVVLNENSEVDHAATQILRRK
ncbi:MAG: hydantoinase B/oxoprolinase family protein [Candidatus Jordarchaeaceae archaeon]